MMAIEFKMTQGELVIKDRGVILVITMIFLFILSLLVITEIENNRYEYQMLSHYKNRVIAFYDAEIVLREMLQKVMNRQSIKTAVKSTIKSSVQIQSNQGSTDYLITVLADYQGAIVKLQACYCNLQQQGSLPHVKLKYWRELRI